MNVFVIKEGKEYNQGVAYLDDGTMVVVDNARSRIGKNLDIVVTSVLQTTAGRMIFGRHAEPGTVHAGPGPASDAGGPRPIGRPSKNRPAVHGPPHKRETAAISLVADSVLPDSRRHVVHRRARHRCRSFSSLVDRSGEFAHRCAQWWARAILATTGVTRRAARRRRRRSTRAASSSRITRASTTCRFCSRRFRDSSGSSPRRRSATCRLSAGTCARSGHLLVDRRNPGAAIFKKMQRMAAQGASLIVFPEGSRTTRRPADEVQGRRVSARHRYRPADRSGDACPAAVS